MSSVLEFATPDIISSANGDFGLDVVGDQDGQNTIWIGDSNGPINNGVSGDDVVTGGSEFDWIQTGDGDDIIIGGAGDDLLDGGAGSDIIRGGDGADIIIGGSGADNLMGGSGVDEFQFSLEDFVNGEIDSIHDFEVGVDKIIINGIDSGLAAIEGNTVKYDGETIINLGGDVTGIQSDATDDDTFELF